MATPAATGSNKPAERPIHSPAQQKGAAAIAPQIVCPHCNTEIELTQTLAAPLIADALNAVAADPGLQRQLLARAVGPLMRRMMTWMHGRR